MWCSDRPHSSHVVEVAETAVDAFTLAGAGAFCTLAADAGTEGGCDVGREGGCDVSFAGASPTRDSAEFQKPRRLRLISLAPCLPLVAVLLLSRAPSTAQTDKHRCVRPSRTSIGGTAEMRLAFGAFAHSE